MLVSKVVVVILFMRLSNAQNSFLIPQPTIEVFNSGRFRISIEDSSGITFVAFHLNINQDITYQQIGMFSKELRHPQHGRWTFEVPNAHLTVGDNINYWFFVVKDHAGYHKLGTHSLRQPNKTQPPPKQSQLQPESCKICSDGEAQPIPTTTPSSSPESNQDPSLNMCEQSLLNTTQHLLGLHSQLEDIRRSNLQLIHLLEQYPDSKILTLTANIPRTNDPARTVIFIIREKLNLNPDIVSAVYINDDRIEFKVATVAEKAEILMIAKEKLVDSKFNIS